MRARLEKFCALSAVPVPVPPFPTVALSVEVRWYGNGATGDLVHALVYMVIYIHPRGTNQNGGTSMFQNPRLPSLWSSRSQLRLRAFWMTS